MKTVQLKFKLCFLVIAILTTWQAQAQRRKAKAPEAAMAVGVNNTSAGENASYTSESPAAPAPAEAKKKKTKGAKPEAAAVSTAYGSAEQSQQPYKGYCKSGNCNNGEGSYSLSQNVVYTGSFKNGRLDGIGRIQGPNWYFTGNFKGDVVEDYKEYDPTAGLPRDGLKTSGTLKLVPYDYSYVSAHFMTDNFYDVGGNYFKWMAIGKATNYRSADMSVTLDVGEDGPGRLSGRVVLNYKGTDYQFNFATSRWAYTVKNEQYLDCLKANNYATDVVYDIDKPAAGTTPAKTLAETLKDMDAAKAADMVARAKTLQTATQEDFCATIQRVIRELPNDFETWKGGERVSYYNFGKEWYSKYMIKGSVYASIFEDRERRIRAGAELEKRNIPRAEWPKMNLNGWHCVLFDGKSDFPKILALYQGYVAKMNECSQTCCTFTSTTKSSYEFGAAGQSTIWKVNTLQPGNNTKYQDMKITISFSMTALGDWFVDMTVQ